MTKPKTTATKKSKAAKAQENFNKNVAKDAEKRAKDEADKAAKKAVDKAAKTVKTPLKFPKIATDAKIQAAGYDASSGAFVKLKDLSYTSGQIERLIAIAQDGKTRVRVTIEEINPTFDATKKTAAADDPTFADAPKSKKKKTSKKKDAKDGSKLPI